MNIIEILKKCPKGTKLYSPIFGECKFVEVFGGITVMDKHNNNRHFYQDGRYHELGDCVLFPSKEERDWNKFQIPYVYKNGDIVYLKTKNGRKYIIIFENIEDDYIYTHIDLSVGTTIWFSGSSFNIEDIKEHRFATETEKQKLFKELKVNGYKWNEESKTVEDLNIPKFKDGDILFVESVYPFIVIYKENENEECFYKYVAIKNYPDCTHIFDGNEPLCHKKGVSKIRFATEKEKQKLFQAIKEKGYRWNAETKTLEKLIVPKFKVGDKIKHKETGDVYKILFTLSDGEGGGVYDVSITNEIAKSIDVKEQDNYELVPDKFDISTLVPFETKVLVRNFKDENWKPAIWGFYNDDGTLYHYATVGGCTYIYLIPYEGNEHLLGKNKDCEDFYKTWE